MLKNYIKIAYRNLLKNKLYAFINVGGLSLGIATTVLLSLWVYNEFTYDDFHTNGKNTYRVTSHIQINKDEVWHWASTPLLLAPKLKSDYPEIEKTTRLFSPWGDMNFKVKDKLLKVDKTIFVDKNWFEVFDYQAIKGSFSDFSADPYNIAITESKAKELFGDANPIDQVIKLDTVNFVVKTVLTDYPPNTNFKYDLFAQIDARLANKANLKNDSDWNNFNYQTFIVSSEKSNIKQLASKITNDFRKEKDDSENENELKLQALSDIHFDSSIDVDELAAKVDKKVLLIFAAIAFLILLTACINYINLTTANLSLRNKEVSVRKFMGVSKSSLFFQFFTESSLISSLAMILSILLIYLGLPNLESMVDNRFKIAENPLVWQILGTITVLSILLNGIYPSVLLSNLKPLELIKGKAATGTKNATFRKGLVVFQFTFTIALIICTAFIFQQLKFIQNKDLGYNKEQVFTINLPWYIDQKGNKSNAIYNQLAQESQIQAITRSSGNIINHNSTHSGSLDFEGRDEEWNPTVSPLAVSENYQEFFGLKLVDGRWFSSEYAGDDNNYILNEAAVKAFKLKEPVVGQRFSYGDEKGQIIGVAKDFHFKSPKEAITPLFFYRENTFMNTFSIKASKENIKGALATTEKIWNANLPNLPFKYSFLDDTYAKMHESEGKQLQLFYTFGLIVLLISCIGLFGLATFAAQVRIKEIGIRKVLGASVSEIINLLSVDFIKLILIAILIASPIAWWAMTQWLQNFAYHININWWVFAIAGLAVCLIALLTVGYQAIRASLMNPVKTLRSE